MTKWMKRSRAGQGGLRVWGSRVLGVPWHNDDNADDTAALGLKTEHCNMLSNVQRLKLKSLPPHPVYRHKRFSISPEKQHAMECFLNTPTRQKVTKQTKT